MKEGLTSFLSTAKKKMVSLRPMGVVCRLNCNHQRFNCHYFKIFLFNYFRNKKHCFSR